MLLAVMSDSHDNLGKIRKAISLINQKGCEYLIHCGDYCAPFILQELNELKCPVYGVFGNVDGDKYLMTKIAIEECKNIKLMGWKGELELLGKKIAFTHYPDFAYGLASTGNYDLVFYGHTHKYSLSKVNNKTRLINPGEIMGRFERSSFIIYNFTTQEVEVVEI